MKTDGSVIIDTKISTDGMEKGFEALKKEMSSVGITVEDLGDKLKLALSGGASSAIQEALTKVKTLQAQLASATAEFQEAIAQNDDKGAARLGAQRTAIYDRLEVARLRLTSVVTKAAATEAAAEATSARRALAEKQRAYKTATKSARAFGKRLTSLVSSAFVFSVIYRGLREVTQYFGKALKSNQKFSESWSKLKGAALTALQPIYEILLPVLTTAVDLAAKLALLIGRAFASLTGKSADQMKKNAQALNEQANATEKAGKAAKDAKKQLAGFDELNVLSSNDTSESTETSTANFETKDIDINSKLSDMATLAASAIFALGIILTLTGVNIPLGLGMIVLGGLLLYESIKENWGGVKDDVLSTADAIALIGGAVTLAIGIILIFAVPSHMALGIGLIIGGAAMLGSAAATNWNALKEALQGPIGEIVAIVSAALLVLGIILLFVPGAQGLGLGLLIGGAAGLATAVAFNWNSIVDWVKKAWDGVKKFWNQYIAPVFTGKFWLDLAKKCGNGLIGGFESAINGIIGLFEKMINWVVGGLNKISFDVPDWVPLIGGKKFGFNIPEAKFGRVSIPRLAQGAVIPPNQEFMAVLGDQKHGTNIEAPLSTIQEAVAAVMADYEAANLAGHEATVEMLREILAAVLGIEIGDSTIGQAANRYNREMAIIKGGL